MHALSHIYTIFWMTKGKIIQVVKIYLSSFLLTYCNISYWRLLKNITKVSKSLLRLGSIFIYYDCFIHWEFYAYVKCTVITSTHPPFPLSISPYLSICSPSSFMKPSLLSMSPSSSYSDVIINEVLLVLPIYALLWSHPLGHENSQTYQQSNLPKQNASPYLGNVCSQ